MSSRIRTTLASLAAAVCLAAAAAPSFAAPLVLPQTVIPGFFSTNWQLINTGSTAPFTGSCDGAPAFEIVDARGPTNTGDAYDVAWEIFINGAAFVAPGGLVGPNIDLTGTTVTAGPTSMSGLQVTVQHYYSPSSALGRFIVTMSNPGAEAVPAVVQVPINFGSDSSSIIRATSSGDTTVTTADRWIVSSDTGPFDPVNTTVFYGPGAPSVVPGSYTEAVFDCSNTNGVGATFNLSIPPGGTRSLMFFAGLGGVTVNDNTVSSAQSAAALFNSTATLPVDWLSGLSSTQKSQIANWSFFSTCSGSGFTGVQLTLCKQICEAPQSPTGLSFLIKSYVTLYRSNPPCAN